LRLPRDVSGVDLARRLKRFGYEITRQTGSHIRLTTTQGGEHHVTVPAHTPLKVGTLSAVLGEVATHLGMSRDALAERLF
jgi:predicted RNA binding protein YcfA (HicA-like mRNA interferase family)